MTAKGVQLGGLTYTRADVISYSVVLNAETWIKSRKRERMARKILENSEKGKLSDYIFINLGDFHNFNIYLS